MNLIFETQYDQRAMTVMAKALRKTIRQKHSRRSHIFGWIVAVLALVLAFWSSEQGFGFQLELRSVVTLLVAVLLVAALLWEDRINGWFARRRLLPGTEKAVSVFTEAEFTSSTEIGTSTFGYDKIQLIAESSNYFVFVFSSSHAQVYDKRSMTGGSPEDFRAFITGVTGKPIVAV